MGASSWDLLLALPGAPTPTPELPVPVSKGAQREGCTHSGSKESQPYGLGYQSPLGNPGSNDRRNPGSNDRNEFLTI